MIAEMKKLYLVAHNSRKAKILKALYRSKFVEVVSTRDIENTVSCDVSVTSENVNEKISKISGAINFINSEKKEGLKLVKQTAKSENKFVYKPIKVKISEKTATLKFDEFESYAKKESELFEVCESLEKINSRYSEIAGQKTKLFTLKSQVEIFSKMPLKPSTFGETDFTLSFFGYFPAQKKAQVEEALNASEFPFSYEIFEGEKYLPIAFVCFKEDVEKLSAVMQPFEFNRSTLDFEMTPENKLISINSEIDILNSEKTALLGESLSHEVYLKDLKIMYDYYLVEQAKIEAEGKFKNTDSVFVLEAFYPEMEEEKLKQILDIVCDEMVYDLREPDDDEEVPTLVVNNKLIKPFESVTDMYSPPSYRGDFDPNPLMSFFYFLFFGMMIADAGYGLLFAIGGFILLKVTKPVPGKGKLILIVTLGGISTFIWGFLFGGWFGIDLELLGIDSPFLEKLISLNWFQPLSEPLLMLALSLGLGVVQIIAGLICNAYNLFRKAIKIAKKNKQKRDEYIVEAFAASISWLFIFLGIGFVALELFLKVSGTLYVGVAFIVIGALTILICQAIKKKSALGLLTGVAKFYDGVNYISDILSYARLFGLGLAGGVVAMVVNMLCSVLISMIGIVWLGAIISIPILIVGHAFNLFISGLGAYVHDARLQFIEFYGKFYEGGGKFFKPLGSNTKYTYIDM